MKAAAEETNQIFTPEELAKRYDTTTMNLANLRYRGTGPRFFKLGRRVYYRAEDVHAYENAAIQERTA